jgi:hypothetical protein
MVLKMSLLHLVLLLLLHTVQLFVIKHLSVFKRKIIILSLRTLFSRFLFLSVLVTNNFAAKILFLVIPLLLIDLLFCTHTAQSAKFQCCMF